MSLELGKPAGEQTKPTVDSMMEALKECYDPELPVNIVDLGLIYEVKLNPDETAYVKLTVTAPGCPAGFMISDQVRETLLATFKSLKDVKVDLVFDPPWDPSRMSEAAKAQLGIE